MSDLTTYLNIHKNIIIIYPYSINLKNILYFFLPKLESQNIYLITRTLLPNINVKQNYLYSDTYDINAIHDSIIIFDSIDHGYNYSNTNNNIFIYFTTLYFLTDILLPFDYIYLQFLELPISFPSFETFLNIDDDKLNDLKAFLILNSDKKHIIYSKDLNLLSSLSTLIIHSTLTDFNLASNGIFITDSILSSEPKNVSFYHSFDLNFEVTIFNIDLIYKYDNYTILIPNLQILYYITLYDELKYTKEIDNWNYIIKWNNTLLKTSKKAILKNNKLYIL